MSIKYYMGLQEEGMGWRKNLSKGVHVDVGLTAQINNFSQNVGVQNQNCKEAVNTKGAARQGQVAGFIRNNRERRSINQIIEAENMKKVILSTMKRTGKEVSADIMNGEEEG